MVEMGGIEPPSNKPLLSRSFRKPKFAHNNAENFSTIIELTYFDSNVSANALSSLSQILILTVCNGVFFMWPDSVELSR